jgi:hypothetical protein
MIVDDFDVLGGSILPNEADPPLVIDPNTMLTPALSLEQLKPIAGWGRQVAQLFRLVDQAKLALSDALDVVRQFFREPAVEKCFGVAVREGSNHDSIIPEPQSDCNAGTSACPVSNKR